MSFQPAQLLQIRQASAQQQAAHAYAQVAAQQAEIQKRIEIEATKRAEGLVKLKKGHQEQKSAQDVNATNQAEDDTTSRGSAGTGGRSQGARKRKAIADANAEKAKGEKGRDELREALGILEEQLGTGTRQYDSEDGTRPSFNL